MGKRLRDVGRRPRSLREQAPLEDKQFAAARRDTTEAGMSSWRVSMDSRTRCLGVPAPETVQLQATRHGSAAPRSPHRARQLFASAWNSELTSLGSRPRAPARHRRARAAPRRGLLSALLASSGLDRPAAVERRGAPPANRQLVVREPSRRGGCRLRYCLRRATARRRRPGPAGPFLSGRERKAASGSMSYVSSVLAPIHSSGMAGPSSLTPGSVSTSLLNMLRHCVEAGLRRIPLAG